MRFILLIAYLTAFAWLFESHAQQNINNLTSKQITVNGKIEVNSTSQSSKPCPAMTEAQRDAIVSPVSGSCVYNTNTLTLNIYNGTIWKSAGGGISNWETAFNYAINDVVIESNKIYQCNTAHTSTTFASDIANWTLISDNLPIDLASDVTGVLPMANGGTDKNLTPVLGGLVYTDDLSMEVLGAGTSGQVLKSNGAAAPTWENASNKVQGQDQTEVDFNKLQFPNKSVTEISTGVQLVETGNVNLFVNANFEASPDFSGHTNTGTGTFAMETNASGILEGNRTGKFQCAPTTVCSSSQTQAIKAGQANLPAMISIVAEAGGADVEFCAIVDSVERGCIPVATKGNYKIPVVTGTTNLGYILRQKSTASPLNIRYDQVKAEIKDTTELAPIVGPRVSYTPVFQGFGTPSGVDCAHSQVGSNIYLECSFTTQSSASQGRIGLPTGLTISGAWTGNKIAGTYGVGATGSNKGGFVLMSPGNNYLTLSTRDVIGPNSTGPLGTAGAGSDTCTPGSVCSFTAIVPIAQYASSVPVYYDRCKDQRNCETEFTMKGSSTCVVSDENLDWINGNGSVGGTGVCNYTLNTGIFTQSYNCTATPQVTGAVGAQITPSSTSSLTISTWFGTSAQAGAHVIKCSRQGQDYLNAKVNQIVGSFKDYNKTEGTATGRVDDFSTAFYGANISTDCSATCTLNQIGDYFSSIVNTSGAFLLTFKRTYSKISCTSDSMNSSFYLSSGVNVGFCENCNSLTLRFGTGSTGAAVARGTISCKGTY